MSVLTDISEGERTGKGSRSESNISCASNIDSEVAKASTVTDNGEVHFGDRLLDDLMNTFCDRLQAACPRKIDGCLAIQFVMVDPQSLKTLLNVGRPAQQIIFDPDRVHYVVVDYDPQVKTVVLYDSLVEKDASATNLLTEPIRRQVSSLFSHLFLNKAIHVAISRNYDRQTDTWSCGYRSIACMVDLARQRNPCETEYCMKSIFTFFQKVISESKVEWQEFETAYFGQPRSCAENNVTLVRLYPDLTFEEVNITLPGSLKEFRQLDAGTAVVSNIEVDTRSENSFKPMRVTRLYSRMLSPFLHVKNLLRTRHIPQDL
ncbi:hypothetical protein Q1695_014445 [Nippostrongylus brasiliensis]|nr:hypothetical protein Q1695_014445 [Nippostrongylus brasiliensis]